MADVDELFASIPVGDIASRLGIDEATAETAVKAAIPTLLGGMNANVAAGGGASLVNALGAHTDDSVLRRPSIDAVDVVDGEKIVRNVFGENKDRVVAAVGRGGVDPGVMGRLLPMLAPIVLSFLAKKFFGEARTQTRSEATPSDNPIGDLLGGLLGGAGGGGGGAVGADPGGSGFDLGGLLGGLLGGSGGIDLGGLLGGGRK